MRFSRTWQRKEGLVAFQLMVPLAIALLRTSPTIRRGVGTRYPFIIVDEFQDTWADQWIFLKLIGENSRVLALGDPDQMIYEGQHQAVLKRVQDFAKWKGIEPTRFDGPNFRVMFQGSTGSLKLPTRSKRGPHRQRRRTTFPSLSESTQSRPGGNLDSNSKAGGPKSNIAFIVPSSRTARQLLAELGSRTLQKRYQCRFMHASRQMKAPLTPFA